MTDPKGQQTGGEMVGTTPGDSNSESTTSTSAHDPGSPEAQIAIPQIVIQPANNSDEISPIAHHLAQRGRPIPPSDRNFLEVPRPSRQSNRRASSHRRSSSKSRRPFGPGNLPLSLTGPVEAFHVPIDPLRMHPTGLTNSSTSPAATATDNPRVMAKVEKMLAANKELKPEPEGFKFSHLLESSFYKKLTSPTRLFSKSKPKQPIKPHQIRHVVSLEPLPTPDEIPRVPSPRLRQNERINVQKREKALQVLGETPQFGAVPASDPARSPPSSAENPFAESSSRGATRAPTAFETRLRTTKSAGALLSGPTADPFQTERVMASNHDSLLPDAPAAASTPSRHPTSHLPRHSSAAAGAGVAAQESPTRAPRTTTTATATTTSTTTATTATTTTAAIPTSARPPRLSRSTSHLDAAPSARPEQRHARPCADAGSDQDAGGCTSAAAAAAATNTTTPTAADNVAGAVVAGAADEGGSGAVEGVVGVVPRLALSLRWVSSGRRRGWVWAEEEERKEGGEGEEELPWWEEDGAGAEKERGEGGGELRGVLGAVGAGESAGAAAGASEGVGGSVGGVGGRWKRHPTPAPADLAALHRQLWDRFPRLAAAGVAEEEASAGPSAGSGEEGASEGGPVPLVRDRAASEGEEDGERGEGEGEEGAVMPGAL